MGTFYNTLQQIYDNGLTSQRAALRQAQRFRERLLLDYGAYLGSRENLGAGDVAFWQVRDSSFTMYLQVSVASAAETEERIDLSVLVSFSIDKNGSVLLFPGKDAAWASIENGLPPEALDRISSEFRSALLSKVESPL